MLELKNDERTIKIQVTQKERKHFVNLFTEAKALNQSLSIFGIELDRASDWIIIN